MSLSSKHALALVAIAFSAAVSGAAGAQGADSKDYPACTKKAAPSDLEAAKGAHKAASEFNERGDYDKAIQYWRDAYGFDPCAHALLINIANAYEKKGDKQAAIVALEAYQARTDNSNPKIAEKIVNLKASLAAPAPVPVPVPVPAPTATPTVAPPPTAAPATTPPPEAGARPFGYVPLIVAGGGVAVLIVGAILLPVGGGAISDAEKACGGGRTCASSADASKGNSGRTEVGVGAAMLGVGAVAGIGGLVWQFAFNKPSSGGSSFAPSRFTAIDGVQLHIEPDVGAHRSGLSLSGAF